MNQSKQIILFFLVLFITSSAYLFIIDSRYNDPKYNNNWFSLSFSDPKSNDMDFVIENFSTRTDFHWEVMLNKTISYQGDVKIESGEKKEFSSSETIPDQKITIRVSAGDETQEIYKNIKN